MILVDSVLFYRGTEQRKSKHLLIKGKTNTNKATFTKQKFAL